MLQHCFSNKTPRGVFRTLSNIFEEFFFFRNSERLKPWGHGATFSCTCNATFLHWTGLIMLSCSHMQIFCVQTYFIFDFLSLKSLFLFKILALKALNLLHLDWDENRETSSMKARKHWVRTWLGNRQFLGWSYSLFQEIKRDTKAFKEFTKMEESQFECLMETLTPMILKEDTIWQNSSSQMKWSA